jgi:hypothetical protein
MFICPVITGIDIVFFFTCCAGLAAQHGELKPVGARVRSAADL